MRRARSVRLIPSLGPSLLVLGMSAVAVGGCRQTVMFDVRRDGGGGTGGGGVGGAGSAFCPGGQTRRLDFALRSPDVIPALDRSSSMRRSFGSTTRLSAARQALREMVSRYHPAVRFGYVEFPGSDLGCSQESSCCPSDALPPSPGTAAFEAALDACDTGCPDSSRPTAAALDECTRVFSDFSTLNGRYVLLLTDGQPGCAPAEFNACRIATDATTRLLRIGVRTHVIDFDSNTDCLSTIASYGLTGTVHDVDSPNELEETLTAIMNPIAREACQVDVLSPPDAREQVALLHNGEEIPRNRTDGWDFDGNSGTSLTLYGDACDIVLEEGAANLDLRACTP